MDLEMVEKAIDSLEGFKGGIGIMGGEPLLHPYFYEICELLRKKVPLEKRFLWTSGYNWKKYRNIVRKTFQENIYYNDHQTPLQKHQPILLAIKDVLKDREYMDKLISECWIQKMWSPSINPKGGFFCEVAAAMDMLFDGPGGYPLEKGWYNRTPEEFRDQIERYCYNCGSALPYPPVSNKEGKDYVSITNYKKLEKLKTKRFLKGCVKLIEREYSVDEIKKFAEDWQPWNYLGEEKRKSYYFLYGPFWGFVVNIRKKIRKKIRRSRSKRK